MYIKSIFSSVLNLFLSFRQSGTTSLINKISKDNDCYILVPNEEEKQLYDNPSKVICFNEIDNIIDKGKKPILIDNYTIIKLCEHFKEYKKEMEIKVNDRNKFLEYLHDEIHSFQKNPDKFIKEKQEVDKINTYKFGYSTNKNKLKF